jgi:tRNA1Val (adenine37-N6)-methyltransferase
MPNDYFAFKEFTIWQDRTAMKVTTDACLFGAWVSKRIQEMYSSHDHLNTKPLRAADVGAGTGLLSLMLHQKNPDLLLEGIEIDPQAAEQARQNIAKAGAAKQIKIYDADATEFMASAPFDFIISNPPFYKDDLKATRPKKNWAFHEGTLSLAALLGFISKQLSTEGHFFLMLPYRREQELMEQLPNYALLLTEKTLVRPAPMRTPHRILIAGKRKKVIHQKLAPLLTVQELIIATETGTYSNPFCELLSDYYLFC